MPNTFRPDIPAEKGVTVLAWQATPAETKILLRLSKKDQVKPSAADRVIRFEAYDCLNALECVGRNRIEIVYKSTGDWFMLKGMLQACDPVPLYALLGVSLARAEVDLPWRPSVLPEISV